MKGGCALRIAPEQPLKAVTQFVVLMDVRECGQVEMLLTCGNDTELISVDELAAGVYSV